MEITKKHHEISQIEQLVYEHAFALPMPDTG